VSCILRGTSRHGTRATATATSTRRRSYPFSAAAWPLAAQPDRLRPPGFRLSTALLDSDNGPSFYATRMTHRFGGGDAMLPDSDGRCFLAAAGDELRMTYRFSGFTRISHYSAAGLNLRDWLKVLSSSFQCVRIGVGESAAFAISSIMELPASNMHSRSNGPAEQSSRSRAKDFRPRRS
jgi:hypothetical protein